GYRILQEVFVSALSADLQRPDLLAEASPDGRTDPCQSFEGVDDSSRPVEGICHPRCHLLAALGSLLIANTASRLHPHSLAFAGSEILRLHSLHRAAPQRGLFCLMICRNYQTQ